jgi:predicted ATPase/DNA-binding winged helix-turn-helix (wHTH) protein
VSAVYRFGEFELRLTERQLLANGQSAALGARAFDVLRVLAEHAGRLVTKAELLDAVWPNLVVEEANLHVQISALRKLIGPQGIATVPGQGYRFAMALKAESAQTEAARSTETAGAVLRESPAFAPALGTLIGRDDEIARIDQLLARHAVTSLVGPAGIGKTRLARAVAARSAGAWWVDLAACRSGEQVVPSIAQAAHAELSEAAADAATLARALARHVGLLVLDNCEHVTAHVAMAVEALRRANPDPANLRILLTSQMPLKLADEYVLRIEPLACPPNGVPLEAARCYSAVQLLEQRAQLADRRFKLEASAVPAAIELCRRLDGNALAIEMAAARLPWLGFQALLDRLDQRLRLLRDDARNVSQRHRSLRAALEWSYALCTPQEQAVLDSLSMFEGSFGLPAAQRVGAAAGLDEWSVLDAMGALVDKSLLHLSDPEPPRYRLLDSTRAYAREQLRASTQHDAAIARYRQAMVEVALAAEQAQWVMSDHQWLQRHAADLDDWLAAFDQAVAVEDAGAAVALAGGIGCLGGLTMRAVPGRRERLRACFALLPKADALSAARIWSVLSNTVIVIDEVPLLEAARRCLAAWHALGQPFEQAMGWLRLAALEAEAGHPEAAIEALRQGSAMPPGRDTPRARARAALAAAEVHVYAGETAALRQALRDALGAAEEGGLERSAALAQVHLGELALIDGELERARELAQRGVDALQALDMRSGLGVACANLCAAQLLCERSADALRSARQSWPVLQQQELQGLLFFHLGLIAALGGDARTGAQFAGLAEGWFRRRGKPIEPSHRPLQDRLESLIADALDAGTAAAARRAGAELSEAEAASLVAEALRGEGLGALARRSQQASA